VTGFSQPVSERRTRDARPVDDNPHAHYGRPNGRTQQQPHLGQTVRAQTTTCRVGCLQ
jgi:hypothetical protein